ncbi:hypothetical protein [Chroococcidiopsis sp. SAG 2025]|nr:hypothetical protein [Chroococcidiopsis sp. SAG 2025]
MIAPVASTEGDEVRDSATSKTTLAPLHPTPHTLFTNHQLLATSH